MRPAFLWLHRWTGIVLAIYIAAIGLSGSILVFYDEIVSTFRVPHVEASGEPAADPDSIVESLQREFPNWHLHSLAWPRDSRDAWFAELLIGKVGVLGETAVAVYLHPRTGEILRVHDYGKSFLRWTQVMHINLFSGREGRTVNGMFALAAIFSLLTGILLWMPKDSGAKALWKVNASARPKRFIWELHQVTGIYLACFFFVVCLTGSYFAWSSQFARAIGAVFPTRFMGRRMGQVHPEPNARPQPLSSFLPSVSNQVPGYPVTRVIFPDGPTSPIRFTVYEGSPPKSYQASNLFYDPFTGRLMRADLLRDRLPGDSIVSWIAPVHFGAFGSWITKILWVLGGLCFPLLAISGVIIYVNKRAAVGSKRLENEPAASVLDS